VLLRRALSISEHDQEVDDNLGEVIRAVQARGLWEKTLVVFQADNGGPIGFPTGGNNFPLRGGKASSWDGGFRTPAFVSGGALPPQLRGATYAKATMISDWYATFCKLAHGSHCTGWGADPTGEVVPGIVPVESVDLWDYFTGRREGSPHPVLPLSATALLA
jgi:arylsulfatase A-like enzyme